VAHADHEDNEVFVDDLVDDPLPAHAQTAQPGELSLQHAPVRGGCAEPVDRFNQAQAVGRRQLAGARSSIG